MNLTRTREQGQTVVPTCIEPLSWWNESFELPTVSSITGDSVKRIVLLCVYLPSAFFLLLFKEAQ
ncbi:hypothetical protein Hanom_Chr16g01459621 [Helianthus anomalus]